MKKFVGIEGAKPKRGAYPIAVYQICKGGLSYLGETKICYASTRGDTSEVLCFLCDNGHLPKKEHGYYSHSNGKYKIQYIVPLQ